MPQVLTTTDAAAARPLHAAGRPVPELHAQIAAVLAGRLGPDHAALLARPQRSASGGWRWASERAGPALPGLETASTRGSGAAAGTGAGGGGACTTQARPGVALRRPAICASSARLRSSAGAMRSASAGSSAGRPAQRAGERPGGQCQRHPAAEVPQFVIVFDASPSMAYSLNASPAQIEQAENAQEQAEAMRAAGLLRGPTPLERIMVEPHRMTPAREAVVALAGRVPADVPIGLVMVDSCTQGARPVGMFAPAKRPALIARLRALRPAAFSEHSGTPLADGVAEGGRLVDGVNRGATMLVVSDGEESCNGDPCAAAAALARAKPRLRINVLDITGTGAGNGVAAATRGRVLTARNAAEIATRMRQAAQEAMAPAGCASS